MGNAADLTDPQVRGIKLDELRKAKMARSAHAFVRGSTQDFYTWLRSAQGLKLPDGPAVWICGDCHSGNLGPIASPKGKVEIQLRDLDQTVIGNPSPDVIRLGLSLASAARSSDLPGIITAKMMESLADGYSACFADDEGPAIEPPPSIERALRSAMSRKWRNLAEERFEDHRASLPLGKHFWPLSAAETKDIEALFGGEPVRRLITAMRSRDDDASVELLDAAYWVKGCSSLGLLRYAVLVQVGGKAGEICLIDIKEATKALAPSANKAAMPKNNAERVVRGAWEISPYLGNRMTFATVTSKPVFLRELAPQDLKLEMTHLSESEALDVARYLAFVVGRAHARQMDGAARKAWRATLASRKPTNLDAPPWLWTAVVELMATHEAAYLQHCRQYALGTAACNDSAGWEYGTGEWSSRSD